MNGWTWESNEQDITGYAVHGDVRIKMESFKDFHTIMTFVDHAVTAKTQQYVEELRLLANKMEECK